MLMQKTVQAFVTELASDSPAPGGGSAAALAGCLGAALTKMVCNLSLDEEKYKSVLPEIQAIQTQTGALLEKLILAVDEDAQAFNEVMDAYKLPKADETEKALRLDTIQQAMKKAALKVIEDSFLPQSGSISADGLSQSISNDMEKHHDTIDRIINGGKGNGGLMAAIHGIRLQVM